METRLFITCMILLVIPLCCPALPGGNKSKNPFEFIEHLKGCHKGENVKGLHELKQYLKRFGYLDDYHQSNNVTHDDHFDDLMFDDLMESAIKTYQLNYHLNTSGTLDDETVTRMMKPRCGVPDIVNGTTSMRSGKKNHHHGTTNLHTVSHYKFFPGSPKWPKTHLTYAFLPGAPVDRLSPPCRGAFARWASVSHFTFEEIQDANASDITIGVYRRDHGDGDVNAFDGPGETIAHAFPPVDGRFHFDWDEPFVSGIIPGAYDLQTVAVHEIGHLLGLDHSDVEDAIMWPAIEAGVRKDLHGDDVAGIRALYGR